jgi:hypothetical protein
MILLTTWLMVVSAAATAAQTPSTADMEKALIGTWAGTWTGGSSGSVVFTIKKTSDGKLAGSATPSPTEGDSYTTEFTSVTIDGNKVTMKMPTVDRAATITIVGAIEGSSLGGTYSVMTPDGTEADRGTFTAKKK